MDAWIFKEMNMVFEKNPYHTYEVVSFKITKQI